MRACGNPDLGPHVQGPAFPFHVKIPPGIDGLALDPGNHSRNSHGDIQRDNEKPDKGFGFFRGQAEEGYREGDFGQGYGGDGDGGAGIEGQEKPGGFRDV